MQKLSSSRRLSAFLPIGFVICASGYWWYADRDVRLPTAAAERPS
jgi:hypothetical protein